MKFIKRKTKLLTITIGAVAVSSILLGGIFYGTSQKSPSSFGIASIDQKENFINKDNLDYQKARPSIKDNNLKEIPKPKPQPKPEPQPTPFPDPIPTPPKKEELKKPEIKPEEPKKPEIKPEPIPKPKPQPIPQPTPPVETKPKEELLPPSPPPPKEEPKPEPDPQPQPQQIPNQSTVRKIELNGVLVDAEVEVPPPRQTFKYDQDNGLSNLNPYTNISVGKIKKVFVTDELRHKSADLVRGNLKRGDYQSLVKDLLDPNIKPEEIDSYIAMVDKSGYHAKLWSKFKKLFDTDNVVNFLNEQGKKEYPNMKIKFVSDAHKYAWLYAHLDFSKFTKLSANSEKYLQEGLTPDPDNSYVNENGELDSYAYSPAKEYNTVTSRLANDNANRRVFGYNEWYNRSPNGLANGDYPGWNKSDATAEFKQYGIKDGDGIKVYKLERQKPQEGKLNTGYIVDIDADNPDGYQKTKELIQKLNNQNKKITGYRIRNMGKSDSGQKFSDILKALPNELPLLELFFSAGSHNTSALSALETKHIKELGLYTLGNSLLDEWSINPNALRKVEWINSNDYNVSSEYKQGSDIATRITFDTLSFDKNDFNDNANDLRTKLKRINDGLRMVYWTRNNEPFFQGGFGPGLDPDHKEVGNSYPQGLDFSRVPQIRSLRGLIFKDEQKASNNRERKLRRVNFFNDKENYEMSINDLNEAGFSEHIVTNEPMPPKSKITFSNGNATKRIYIKGNGSLTASGIQNLATLFNLAESLDSKSVVVDSNNSELKSQLEGLGYKVSDASDANYIDI